MHSQAHVPKCLHVGLLDGGDRRQVPVQITAKQGRVVWATVVILAPDGVKCIDCIRDEGDALAPATGPVDGAIDVALRLGHVERIDVRGAEPSLLVGLRRSQRVEEVLSGLFLFLH